MTAPERPAGLAGEALEVAVLRGAAPVRDALAAAAPLLAGSPVSARPAWLSCWLAAFTGYRVVAVVVRRGGDVTGLACLAYRRRGPLAEVVLAGDGPSDHGRLAAADPDSAASLADGVAGWLRRLRGPWRLRLDQLPEDDPVAARLAAVLPGGALAEAVPTPVLELAAERTVDAQLTSKLRRSMRRAQRLATSDGQRVDTTLHTTRDAIAALLPEFQALQRDRDHQLGRRSPMDDPAWAGFHRRVVLELAATGEIEVHTVRIDGELAIYGVVLRDGDTLRCWDTRMSGAAARAQPGYLLDHSVLSRAVADPAIRYIDWLRGTSSRKNGASTAVVTHRRLLAHSSRAVARWDGLTATLRDTARRLPVPVRRLLRGDPRPALAALTRRR